VKVLPNAQQFDPADRKYTPFYRALAERSCRFSVMSATNSASSARTSPWANPDRLRLALDEGATVIAAHACSYGLILYEKFLPTCATS
jgi:predicted TIM-barrel fold metal-dependent hydrolase